jgi:Tol biopolymer transport system component
LLACKASADFVIPLPVIIARTRQNACLFISVSATLARAYADNSESRWNFGRAGGFHANTPSVSAHAARVIFDSATTGNGDIYSSDAYGSNIIRLTYSASVEMAPLLSPSGTRIAFARQADGYQHIWLMDASGSNELRLTQGRVIDEPSAFSKDERRLFFIRTTFKGRALLPLRKIYEGIWAASGALTINMIGEGERISSDGTMFLHETLNATSGKDEIWLTDVRSGTKRLIAYGSSPDFSPDGKAVAYLVRDQDYLYQIRVTYLDQAGSTLLPFSGGYKTRPRFSPDGKSIVFRVPSSVRDGTGGIYLINLDSLNAQRIGPAWKEPL